MREEIEKRLRDKLTPTELEVIDDSASHAGHREAKAHPEHGHYQVRIVSPLFAGKSVVEQHRMVYAALGELMQSKIHALALVTKAAK